MRVTKAKLGNDIASKIRKKAAKIGIVGLGQVGLPTALSFIRSGFHVIGYDTNSKLIGDLSHGVTAISERGIRDLLVEALAEKKVLFVSSRESLADADVIIICVPTPLGPDLGADFHYLTKAISDVGSVCLKSKKLVIIESSIPPGTISTLILPTLERITGKELASGFLLAFCPERLSPGQALSEISNAVRVIGISDDESFNAASALYSNLTSAEIVKSDFETAEISKLAENAFRDVNIAFANELAKICQDYNTGVNEVIKIANTHPRVNILNPGPGVGGPCLPKDPYLLTCKSNTSASLIRRARSINDSMPGYLVEKLVRELQMISDRKVERKTKIGILGVAYKPNVNDYQNSPAKKIISELLKRGYQDITVHDPLCEESFGMNSNSDLKSLLKDSECVIVVTGHETYASLLPDDFKQGSIILDTAQILSKDEFEDSTWVHFIALGGR